MPSRASKPPCPLFWVPCAHKAAVDSTDVVWVLADTNLARFNTSGSPLSSFSTGIGAGLTVDGSNHVGAMVTWNARTASPAGCAAVPCTTTKVSATAPISARVRRRTARESMVITCS